MLSSSSSTIVAESSASCSTDEVVIEACQEQANHNRADVNDSYKEVHMSLQEILIYSSGDVFKLLKKIPDECALSCLQL